MSSLLLRRNYYVFLSFGPFYHLTPGPTGLRGLRSTAAARAGCKRSLYQLGTRTQVVNMASRRINPSTIVIAIVC